MRRTIEIDTPRVEKGIPIPEQRLKRGTHTGSTKETRLPWQIMGVGDSFLFPAEPGMETNYVIHRIGATMKYRALKFGEGFVTRSVVGGVRVWRVK